MKLKLSAHGSLFLLLASLFAVPAQAETVSREFKLPLRTEPFTAQLDAAGSAYARRLSSMILAAHGAQVLPTPKSEKLRTVRFLDTFGSCKLRTAGFILRMREDDKGRQQLTLKTRSSDTDWVRKTELNAVGGVKVKTKLEEDVLPPDLSQLSRSVTITLGEGQPVPFDLEGANRMFPVLAATQGQEMVGPVENLLAKERAYVLPKWTVGGVEFEAEIGIWFGTDGKLGTDGKVLFAEGSFRYVGPTGAAEAAAAAAAAAKLFAAMQADTEWAGPLNMSKTDYVYNAAGGRFCKRTFGSTWAKKTT